LAASALQFFYEQIRKYVNKKSNILEIGSGFGQHTQGLVLTGANITATDISSKSLEVLKKNITAVNLRCLIADMESLPFADQEFDAVICAGSLSYGENILVMTEINRVLKLGGHFICVDSLNNNPIYKINRWLHFFRGDRTISTLKQIPTLKLINQYKHTFGEIEVRYFGSLWWAIPLLGVFIKNQMTLKSLTDRFDFYIKTKKSAFKFVMVVTKTAETAGGCLK
jgi:ubiquinone/menaquinone biosynthesis C-methylase UbiE